MNETIQKQVEQEIKLYKEIKSQLNIHEEMQIEDARIIFNKITIQENKPSTEKKEQKKKKKGLQLGKRYDFKEMPGQATNKQLEFIQFLRSKAKEGELKISVTVENVPKMKYEEADNEIKRLKEKLKWPDKQE